MVCGVESDQVRLTRDFSRVSLRVWLLVFVAEEAAQHILRLLHKAAFHTSDAQQTLHLITERRWDMVGQEAARHLDNSLRGALGQLGVLRNRAHNLVERCRLRQLRRLVGEKYRFVEETIRLRREGNLEGALSTVRSRRGKELMDQIRAECRAMSVHEMGLLSLRREEASREKATMVVGVGIGLVLMISMALVSLLTVDAPKSWQRAKNCIAC